MRVDDKDGDFSHMDWWLCTHSYDERANGALGIWTESVTRNWFHTEEEAVAWLTHRCAMTEDSDLIRNESAIAMLASDRGLDDDESCMVCFDTGRPGDTLCDEEPSDD